MIFEYIDLRATTRQKNEMFFKTTLEPIMLQPMIKKKKIIIFRFETKSPSRLHFMPKEKMVILFRTLTILFWP